MNAHQRRIERRKPRAVFDMEAYSDFFTGASGGFKRGELALLALPRPRANKSLRVLRGWL